ncbi:hypothetical protein PR048_015879 [Dryococelus australis]|uniref:Uncharacterized protein n=1 Tax=Dryococelus australis TaxID=614101 RepID=A0ABQ9HI64_9NEOP|nr:hypothetical protein PR048_015879 [Dryococelus australis]
MYVRADMRKAFQNEQIYITKYCKTCIAQLQPAFQKISHISVKALSPPQLLLACVPDARKETALMTASGFYLAVRHLWGHHQHFGHQNLKLELNAPHVC